MKVRSVDLFRIRTPFRQSFRHAAAVRAESDAVIVRVTTDDGTEGFGEVQARSYVTGESNDEIWQTGAASLAARIIGAEIRSIDDVVTKLGGMQAYERSPAMVGGFDLALLDVLELNGTFGWADVFGIPGSGSTTRCLTIGCGQSRNDLRRQAMMARVGKCGVVKLKVNCPDDADRIAYLRESLGSGIRLRLDANGEMNFQSALDLLMRASAADVESFEEPLDRESDTLEAELTELNSKTGVPLVADESVCTAKDVRRFADLKAYQIVNLRVGKCGGVIGTQSVLLAARSAGFGIVCGTMVGETAVLLRVSRELLARLEEIDYVEGLDQASNLLVEQTVLPVTSTDRHFELNKDSLDKYLISKQTFC